MSDCRIVEEFAFDGLIVEWRGPAPFYFVQVPESCAGALRTAARHASYGWGCVRVAATIADIEFTTSLIPRHDSYLLPLKAAVRNLLGVAPGETVHASLRIASPGAEAAARD